MTSRHTFVTVDGFTHASSVIPVVRCRETESLIVTRELDPLNTRAPPNLPEVVHVALVTVPTFPMPDESATVVPVPSLNEYAATSPAVVNWVVALATLEYVLRLLAASVARTR